LSVRFDTPRFPSHKVARCLLNLPSQISGLVASIGEENGMATMHQLIREIRAEHGRARAPSEPGRVDATLFAAGLGSRTIVNEQFEIELPDEMCQRRWFIDTVPIESVLASLTCTAGPTCT